MIYRGIEWRLCNDRGEWYLRGSVPCGGAFKICEKLRQMDQDHAHYVPTFAGLSTKILDCHQRRIWEPGTRSAMSRGCVAIDGVPWEIHRICNPTAYIQALRAFKAAK